MKNIKNHTKLQIIYLDNDIIYHEHTVLCDIETAKEMVKNFIKSFNMTSSESDIKGEIWDVSTPFEKLVASYDKNNCQS